MTSHPNIDDAGQADANGRCRAHGRRDRSPLGDGVRQAPDDDQRRRRTRARQCQGECRARRVRKEELRGQEDRPGDEKPEAVPGATLPAVGVDGKQDRAQRADECSAREDVAHVGHRKVSYSDKVEWPERNEPIKAGRRTQVHEPDQPHAITRDRLEERVHTLLRKLEHVELVRKRSTLDPLDLPRRHAGRGRRIVGQPEQQCERD